MLVHAEVEKDKIIKKNFIILDIPQSRMGMSVVSHRRDFPEQVKREYRMMVEQALRGDATLNYTPLTTRYPQ